jgi:predicted GIY-YIG superfamily endonuclease
MNVLYRFFDFSGQLLYVGMTNNPSKRLRRHRSEKWWWVEIANIQLQHFSNRYDLRAAELEAIRSEKPIYNIVENDARVPNKFSPWRRHQDLMMLLSAMDDDECQQFVAEARQLMPVQKSF